MAILDADKEGFLRNETSLIQTIGRAAKRRGARHPLCGYHHRLHQKAVDETERRRALQKAYNKARHHAAIRQKEVNRKIDLTEEVASQTVDIGKLTGMKRRLTSWKKKKKTDERGRRRAGFRNCRGTSDRIKKLKGEL